MDIHTLPAPQPEGLHNRVRPVKRPYGRVILTDMYDLPTRLLIRRIFDMRLTELKKAWPEPEYAHHRRFMARSEVFRTRLILDRNWGRS